MRVDIFSLLPEVMAPYLQASVLGKAQVAGLLQVELHNIRDYTNDRHRTTDDEPFGGGGGMLMKPEPIFAAVESVPGGGAGSDPPHPAKPSRRALHPGHGAPAGPAAPAGADRRAL